MEIIVSLRKYKHNFILYKTPGDASWNSVTLNKIRNLIKQ